MREDTDMILYQRYADRGRDAVEEALQDTFRTAREIATSGPICDECLGRPFARCGTGWSNAHRGRALRVLLSMAETPVPRDDRALEHCWVCGGLFCDVDRWAERAAERAAAFEYETYLFGVTLPPRLVASEELLAKRFPTSTGEPMKHAFNREVGKAFERRTGHGTVSFSTPDLSFRIDPAANELTVRVASLFVAGRYRKLARGIPQTHWPCRACRGRGCPACDGTGKQYPDSVEELIAGPFIAASGARAARLHGAGREDIDARMLGDGRPFVLEILSPRTRSLDLDELRAGVHAAAEGKVELSALGSAVRADVRALKASRATKRYRAAVEFERSVDPAALKAALASLVGVIEQRTPRRVAHRRADRVRQRRLHEASGEWQDPRHASLEFHTDAGLYVKELISGDEGRTTPSLAERLAAAARVTALDVTAVLSDDPSAGLNIEDPLP